MAPAQVFLSISDFNDSVKTLMSSGQNFDKGYHIRYEDLNLRADPAYMLYYPGKKLLAARGLCIEHFDRCMQLFDVFNEAIPLTTLALSKCEFRASTFTYVVSIALKGLIINHVDLCETIVPLDDLSKPWTKIPAYWHNVLPLIAQQGAIKHCQLQGLKDGYTTTNPEHWEGVKFVSEDEEATKLGLMNLAAGWRGAAVFQRDPGNEMVEEEAMAAPRDEPIAPEPAATEVKKEEDAAATKSRFSCDKCSKLKQGCDKAIPACKRCQDRNLVCVYSRG